MHFWKPTAALLMMACRAATQDLSPDVRLLARIKSHMREELSHLANYTSHHHAVRPLGSRWKRILFTFTICMLQPCTCWVSTTSGLRTATVAAIFA
jgi:hypothetical protein